MKHTHKAALDNKASRQPDAHQVRNYSVSITLSSDDDVKQQPITVKTVRLADLPALLQALTKIEDQHAALA